MSDFDLFWSVYPRKVAKLDAIKAYGKARMLASAEDILIGVERYRAHLPEEMRFIAHPASWLRAGRWLDEYDAPVQKAAKVDWFAECQQLHGGACGLDRFRHGMKMRESA